MKKLILHADSYFLNHSIQAISALNNDKQFDIQLIPEFSRVATNLSIVKWLEQMKLVCELCDFQELK